MVDITALKDKRSKSLHDAVIANNAEAATALLELGVDPNELDSHGFAPMHYTAAMNSVLLTQLLLDYGASMLTPSERCENPSCLEAMQCIVLDKVSHNTSPVEEQTETPTYFIGRNQHGDEDKTIIP